jgi:F0F1-type ATP synthase delta subunit
LHTDPTLALGVRVRIGDMMVDNSIAGQLAEVRESVSQGLKERLSNE